MSQYKNKFKYITLFIGIFIIVYGLLFSDSLLNKIADMNGRYGFNKIQFNLKDQKKRLNNSIFRIEHLDDLTKEFKSNELNFFTNCKGNVFNGSKSREVNVIGTFYKYDDFNSINYIKGCFFNKNNYQKQVVVIDQDIAWEIFGSLDVLGKEIESLGKNYKIVGITNMDKSNIYIPLPLLLNKKSHLEIANVTVRMTNAINKNNILYEIQRLGVDLDNYNIIDYEELGKLLEIYSKFILVVIGLITIILIFKLIVYQIKSLIKLKKLMFKSIIKLLIEIILIVFIFKSIYIKLDFINYNIFDYIKLFNANYPSQKLIILILIAEVVTVIFTILVGNLILNYSVKIYKDYSFTKMSFIYILSIIITIIITRIYGLNTNINIQQLIIVYIYLSLSFNSS